MARTLNGFNEEPVVINPQGFRIRRAQATVTGFQPSVDPHAATHLAELDALLKKRIFADIAKAKDLLASELTPRRSDRPGVGSWAAGSLADKLRDQKAGAGELVLGELIDADSDLAALRYGFDEALDDSWNELDFNVKAVLAYSGVRDLVVLRAYTSYKITAQTSLMNFVLNHPAGITTVVRYAAVSAARDYVVENQLRVTNIDKDDSDAVKAIIASVTNLSSDAVEGDTTTAVMAFTEGTAFDHIFTEAKVIVPDSLRPRLIQYLKTARITLTTENAPFVVPMSLARLATTTPTSGSVSSDDPFAVQFFVEDSSSLQVSTAAVRCAAQLYYVMVLGDELGVFDAVRFFTHRYLFRDGFAVEDPQLRRDLENYVFSEQFPGTDDMTGDERMMRCTRAGERRSFYRQVFDQGNEPVPGDGMPNNDFARLWKILMLESARYLEKAQASPNPDNFVSRQNVMQSVEDLQYNLSTSCVGMATVMTPLMYAELDFVVTRILGHPEVRKHLIPSGGSWWKVVEKLQAGQGRIGRASVLHNKARVGYALIRDIASYLPSQFEQDGPFSEFISNVDAFITTQSIVQEEASHAGSPADRPDRDPTSTPANGYGEGSAPGMPDLSRLPGMPGNIPGVTAPWPGTPGGTTASNGAGLPGTNGSSPATSTTPEATGASGDWDF